MGCPHPIPFGRAAYTIEGEPAEQLEAEVRHVRDGVWRLFPRHGHPAGGWQVLYSGRPIQLRSCGDRQPVHGATLLAGTTALGKRMHVGNPQKGYPWATVVGVVADVKMGSGDEPSEDQWYTPAEQPTVLNGSDYSGRLTSPASGYITLRSALPPEQMTQTLRSTVAEVDPMLALQEVQPMEAAISNVEAPRRFNTDLITTFAVGALLLAITGIYAVVAFSVSLRTQELAIRIALGAQRIGIARLVLISAATIDASWVRAWCSRFTGCFATCQFIPV